MTTGRLGYTELAPAQADPEATVNELAAFIASLANRAVCADVLLATPPGSPAEYDTYVVGPSATGAWATHDDDIAFYYNGSWLFIAPQVGMEAYDQSTGDEYTYVNGSPDAWTVTFTGGGGSFVAATTTETLTGTSATKGVTPDSLAALWGKGADIASASTISIGEGGYFIVTGTTAITDIDFATPKDGRAAILSFSGALTLTHNATTLILPGGANITTAAGDCCLVVQENSDNVRVAWYQKANGQSVAGSSGAAGKQSIWIPASAMTSRTTNGAASGQTETATNKIMISTLNFDASTQEFAQFQVRMPKSWNEGTVTFQPVWSHASTATNFGVVWALEAVAFSDDDALDAAFGTAQTSTDTGGTTDDAYIGPESSAITIGGSPAAQDYVVFQIKRNPSDGSDTLAIDARLHGITLFYTTDAENDA